MSSSRKLFYFSTTFFAVSASGGGYDPCSDYPADYLVWLVLLAIIYFFGLLLIQLLKIEKSIQSLGGLLLASLFLLVLIANISITKNYLEVKYSQKIECIFPSPDNSSSNISEEGSTGNVTRETQPVILITRDEFRSKIMNQTQDSVISLIGKPDSTSESSDTIYWYYNNKTIDPVTDKIDYSVQVIFEHEAGYKIVKSINFN